jgi:hypothetical protein
MENVEKKSGFRVARSITTIVIGLLMIASFLVFSLLQKQSNHLVDYYLASLNDVSQVIVSASTILSSILLPF